MKLTPFTFTVTHTFLRKPRTATKKKEKKNCVSSGQNDLSNCTKCKFMSPYNGSQCSLKLLDYQYCSKYLPFVLEVPNTNNINSVSLSLRKEIHTEESTHCICDERERLKVSLDSR